MAALMTLPGSVVCVCGESFKSPFGAALRAWARSHRVEHMDADKKRYEAALQAAYERGRRAGRREAILR